MNRLSLCIAVMATAFFMQNLNAQVERDSTTSADTLQLTRKQKLQKKYADRGTEYRIEQLVAEKAKIAETEKNTLKSEIERIDQLQASGSITADQAKEQKMEAARIAALNIDNKTAIIDNKLALQERGINYNFSYAKGSTIELGLGNAYDDKGSMLFGVGYSNESPKVIYDKRTYSDVVIAIGKNNALRDGESLSESPYKIYKSTYLELGYTFSTRLLNNSNAVRVLYGLSMQFQRFESDNNQYFEDQNGQTFLADFGTDLKKSNMRFDNLVLPVFFEFGPSKKVEFDDRFRYDTRSSFKFGIGGFAGINLSTVQSLKYNYEGETELRKTRADYNTSKFVYGLNSYIGFGSAALFVKYDLNPVFRNAENDQHNIAAGLRFNF